MKLIFVCTLSAVLLAQQFPPTRPPTGTGRGGGTQGRGGATGQQPPARPMNSRERSATGDAIDRYVKGDFKASLEALGRLGGFDTTNADEWILSGGPGAVQKRRLIAAVVALEYTASRPGLSPSLFDWGAKTLSDSVEPEPAEELWLRASIALAEGRDAWPILMGLSGSPAPRPRDAAPRAAGMPQPATPATAVDPLVGRGHLAYALSRFPDDPHFKLARIVAAEAASSPPPGAISLAPAGQGVAIDQIDAQTIETDAGRATEAGQTLKLAAAALEELRASDAVGAEARLRLGYIQLRLGHHDLALHEFTDVHASEPFVSYLAHLFAGWTLAHDGRADAAVAEYRAALGVVPHARSASTLLTAFCIMSGRPADAEALATELMTKPAVAEDPWRGYLLGDYREYPALIAKLREAMQ